MNTPQSRRDFLNVSWRLAVGVVLPSTVAACGGVSDGISSTPEIFV